MNWTDPHRDPELRSVPANDSLKRSFAVWLWSSIIAATFLHFTAFALWPTLNAEDFSLVTDALEAIELPPEVEIPPPPQQIARPAAPIVSSVVLDEDVTIAPTTFEDNPIEELPPPPTESATDISTAPTFTPFTVAPSIRNTDELVRAMGRAYPQVLRDAGIGGTVRVFFFIDEQGRVRDSRIDRSSGYAALDQAALSVAQQYRFSPALNRDQTVPVWVSLPITFRVE